jgi:hypothetical protein
VNRHLWLVGLLLEGQRHVKFATTQAERDEQDQLRRKLHAARQAALAPVMAYNKALADFRGFVEAVEMRVERFSSDRSDKWQARPDDDGHKADVYHFGGDYHHASLNLQSIEFDAATKKHVEIADALPDKVAGQG